ncbi:MAG: tetratricopeptide repeat protein [Candidatus Acidoferrales bacterium]
MADAAKAYQQADYAEAEKLFLAALKEAEKFGEQDPRFAASLNNLAELYRTLGKYAQAEPLYERALAIAEKALGPEHPNAATSLENYAALLHKLNRDAEADKMEARAKAIRAKHAEENPPK